MTMLADAFNQSCHQDRSDPPRKEKPPTQAEQLLELAGAANYVHTAEGKAYALVQVGEEENLHTETLSLRTKTFRSWIAREYYRATNKAASSKSMEDVLRVLEARANYDGEERNVHLRIAETNSTVYLDMGDDCWRTIAVDASGWRIVTTGAPLFRRPRGMLALPEPVRGADLAELRPFINVTQEGWRLVVPWMVQALRQRGPYPILNLSGEQGAAKSTAAKVIRSPIDPNAAPLRSQPRDEHDLVIAASNSWVVALDNLSHLEPWFSDALCRLSTGGGFGTRELYSDDEEIIFDAQRPIILNGIEDLATRGDLLDRSVLVRLEHIRESQRLPEAEFWRRYDSARPRILGALLDTLSGALRELPSVQLSLLPRMADFTLLGVAVEKALGWPDGSFLAAYKGNRDDATVATLESSLIFPFLEEFANNFPGRQWAGQCLELLEKLNGIAGDKTKSKYWPASPRSLSGQLRRLGPALRANGINIEFEKSDGSNSKRLVRVWRCEGESVRNEPSQQTQQTQQTPVSNQECDASDGCDGRFLTDSPSFDSKEIFPTEYEITLLRK